MSITTLPERVKRKSATPPKEKRREQEQTARLTAEEIERLTEPGHRKRVTELGRELAKRLMSAD